MELLITCYAFQLMAPLLESDFAHGPLDWERPRQGSLLANGFGVAAPMLRLL
ncbi:hypothetical protein SDJN02_19980 [Cucurbita argyrosperma subsp. argyrosperma]|nr:hypothetical protein SDJN02_19980 [Cucurbita argyrosperma subsp. argyrosperma]